MEDEGQSPLLQLPLVVYAHLIDVMARSMRHFELMRMSRLPLCRDWLALWECEYLGFPRLCARWHASLGMRHPVGVVFNHASCVRALFQKSIVVQAMMDQHSTTILGFLKFLHERFHQHAIGSCTHRYNHTLSIVYCEEHGMLLRSYKGTLEIWVDSKRVLVTDSAFQLLSFMIYKGT